MYTSIKTQLTQCACLFNIISRINNYIKETEREGEREMFIIFILPYIRLCNKMLSFEIPKFKKMTVAP